MEGSITVTKAEGVKLIPKKYQVNYKAVLTEEKADLEKELRKTIEDKIKNLALLSEKIPIDSEKFNQMLRQQLSWETGKFGIRLKEIDIQATPIEEENK